MTVIIFLLVLTALVFVHELGHFLAAKKLGIRVDEFAIGFPPKIFSWKRGETKYSINIIPFGGFVKIFGENPDAESLAGPDASRSFVNKPRWAQAIVLVAGVVFNFLFAWILYSGSFMFGIPSSDVSTPERTVVTEVVKESPAEKAGIKAGDTIVSIVDGDKSLNSSEITSASVKEIIAASNGDELEVTVLRGEKFEPLKVTPRKGIVGDNFALGIGMADISTKRLGFFASIIEGFKTTISTTKATIVGIAGFFKDLFTFNAALENVAGPVGIAGVVGQAKEFGFGYLLSISALISINLAVLNLVPFPALDGGRLLFVGIEAIRRRNISPKITNAVNAVGFALLLILMLVITFSDISKFF